MSTKRDREKSQQIQVFVRTRPLSTQERDNRQTSCIEIAGPKELSVRQQHGKKYVFDRVFAPHVKQVDVYKTVVHPLISEVLAGYNCTVFAYGQTGSGKTHTMVGEPSSNFEVPWQDNDSAGIVPRAMANLFEELHLTQQEHTVRISYIELYNEEVYDLLAESDDNARIRLYEDQHQKGSVIIQGIEQVTVVNNKDVQKILDKGQEKRRTASTLMNSQSSRSHTVFTITVHTRETTVEGDVLVKTGKLNLVDLAGSENISRSGAVEKRAREAGSINQSLLTLGRVIKSLVERSGHVPYRESKLTRILQDSLGGRTKTSIIATISSAICNLEETLSTLDYANRARNITNRPEVNQRMSQKAVMGQYLEELEKLRKDLHATRSGTGIYLAQENYDQLIADNDNDKQELSLKIQHIRDLERNLKDLEDQRNELQLDWHKISESFEKTNEELEICRDRLVQTEKEKNWQEFLAGRYEEKAGQLYDETQSLMTTIKTSKNIDAALREKIEKLYTTAKENRSTAKQMSNVIRNKFEDMSDDLSNFKALSKSNKDRLCDILNNIQTKNCGYFDTNEVFMDYIMQQWRTYATSHKTFAENSQTDFECWMQQFVISCNNRVVEIRKQREQGNSLLKKLRVAIENTNLELNQNFNKIQSKLENSHKSMTTLYQNFQKDLSSHTDDLLMDMSTLKVSTEKQIHSEEMEKQITDSQETLQGIQKSIEVLFSNFAALQNKCKASKEEASLNFSTVNRLDCGITNLCSLNDTSFKNIISCSDKNFIDLKKSLESTEKSQISSKSKQTKLLEDLDASNAIMTDTVEEALVGNIDMQKDVFLVKTRNLFNTDNLELLTHGNDLTNYVVQQTDVVKNTALELNLNFVEAHNCVEDSANSASQFQNQLGQDLSVCNDTISTYTNVKYKEILPSGDTPVRMQYYCPTLNPPTPKDKIFGRFQERLQAMETIIDEPNG